MLNYKPKGIYKMKLSDLINYEKNKILLKEIKENKLNVVPFIGAGISCGCGLYSWNELLVEIASYYFAKNEISILKELDSIEFADRIVDKVGNTSMIMRKIREIFETTPHSYTEVPYILINEFSPLVVTTNYDDIIEKVSEKCSRGRIKPLLPCLQGQFSDAIQLNEHKLLKIHGSIEEISSFVFTSKQYDLAYEKGGLVNLYLKNIFHGKRVLFVGCSISQDRTIEVLKECVNENKDLLHYAIVPRQKEESAYLERNVQLTNLGIQPIYYPEGEYDSIEKILNYLSDDNRFVRAMKSFVNEIIGEQNSDNMDVFYSILSKTFYFTANKYPTLLDIDYSYINIYDYMHHHAISFFQHNISINIKNICLYGFQLYLTLGEIRDKEEITDYFLDELVKELLEETEIIDYLKRQEFSTNNIVAYWDGKRLLELSDAEINALAERQIDILNYKGSMSFDLRAEYNFAEEIIDYCAEKLNFKNRIQLLRGLGAFGMYYNKNAIKYLLECINLISLSGKESLEEKVFLSEVYNDLAILEAYSNTNIEVAINYNEQDIKLKNEAGIKGLPLGISLNLRATLLKELNPFDALNVYIESCNIKERIYIESEEKNKKDVLVSWMLSVFNVGLLAKDLGLYQEAYRIISKANIIRLQIMDKSSKDYCSSINVECELELLLGRDLSNVELLNAIQSRAELPKGFVQTKEHTWYVCALYFYNKKKYVESIKYVKKAFVVIRDGNTICDIRQEVRLSLLWADAQYEILVSENEDLGQAEHMYCDALKKIQNQYGADSIYLLDIYSRLQKRFGNKYEHEYCRLVALYDIDINKAGLILKDFDFFL